MRQKDGIKFATVEKGMIGPATLDPFGETGFIAIFTGYSDVITIGIHCHTLAQKLLAQACWCDVVPAIDSLMVRYRPDIISHEKALADFIDTISPLIKDIVPPPVSTMEMPVFYDDKVAPDLMTFCETLDCDQADLIALHCGTAMRVVAMGFAPGFAYIGSLAPRLQRPRLSAPRPFLPAGSVGLAGAFTGIYSLPSPGGWNIIGRTPLSLFNPSADQPFLLSHNIEVRFRSILEDEYQELDQRQGLAQKNGEGF